MEEIKFERFDTRDFEELDEEVLKFCNRKDIIIVGITEWDSGNNFGFSVFYKEKLSNPELNNNQETKKIEDNKKSVYEDDFENI